VNNNYLNLKQVYDEHLCESKEKKLKKLLRDLELDDKKPSYLIREMQQLAGDYAQRHRELVGLDYCLPYINDVLVTSESKLQHDNRLRTIFERLDRLRLLLNINKCVFGAD